MRKPIYLAFKSMQHFFEQGLKKPKHKYAAYFLAHKSIVGILVSCRLESDYRTIPRGFCLFEIAVSFQYTIHVADVCLQDRRHVLALLIVGFVL